MVKVSFLLVCIVHRPKDELVSATVQKLRKTLTVVGCPTKASSLHMTLAIKPDGYRISSDLSGY